MGTDLHSEFNSAGETTEIIVAYKIKCPGYKMLIMMTVTAQIVKRKTGGGSPYFYFLRVLCIVYYKFVVNKSDI